MGFGGGAEARRGLAVSALQRRVPGAGAVFCVQSGDGEEEGEKGGTDEEGRVQQEGEGWFKKLARNVKKEARSAI